MCMIIDAKKHQHLKRVEIQIKPILGYFFTLDPFGFEESQYIGLLAILGHMVSCQANEYNNKLYKSEWFSWLVNDFTKLCHVMLPKIKNYLINDNGFGGCIQSGDLLNEFILSPKFRSKQIIQNLLVIIGLIHCKKLNQENTTDEKEENTIEIIKNESTHTFKEIEIKFIEEILVIILKVHQEHNLKKF